MERSTTMSSINNEPDDPLENHPLFTPDLEYFTAPTAITLNNRNAYYPRTLTPYNIARATVLPVFRPSSSLAIPLSTEPNDSYSLNIHDVQPPLLLCNVPKQQLSQLQLARREPYAYLSSFELIEKQFELMTTNTDSFMISLYRQLLHDLSLKWNISIPLLDYNLGRLRQCAKRCLEQLQQQERKEQLQLIAHLPTSTTFSLEELPLILEFYLQIDVDLFYMKTCSFRHAQPIEETIFCSKIPEIHYCLKACNKPDCSCCHPLHPRIYPEQTPAIQFNHKKKYQFLNGYETVLNCPATCETTNIIYALSCPCERFDYVGVTTMSFRDCLTKHREESNRIMREFILGPTITKYILKGIKSEEARKNDRMWLYQHTSRCSIALQLFLDSNPDYWCFIPMKNTEIESRSNINMLWARVRSRSIQSRQTRILAEAKYLADQIPDPPETYAFTNDQKQAQIRFFQEMKDQLLSPASISTVDLYNASVIAVLPDPCSEMFRQLVLSLFVTHADCELNQTGRLIDDTMYREYPFRGFWCSDLLRRPPPPTLPSLFS